MTTITDRFGSGGANLPPGSEGGDPTLAQTLQDLADDLNQITPEIIVSPDANDATTASTLANEIKAMLNKRARAYGSVLGTADGPFSVTPTNTLTFKVDGGGTITSTFAAAGAVLTGTIDGPFDLTGALSFRVKINGIEFRMEFVNGDFADVTAATATEIATAMNVFLGSDATASASGSKVRITTAKKGTAASVQVTGGGARGPMGFDTVAVYGTGDAADIDAMTVDELAKKIDTDSAGAAEVIDVGGRALIRTKTVGGSGSIQVTGGSAAATFGLTSTKVCVGTGAVPNLTQKG